MSSVVDNEFDGFRFNKFDVMPQSISTDWRLSPQTKWILVYLLNRKNWKLRVSHFVSMHKDSDAPVSEKSVYRSLKTLLDCGYMTRTRLKEGNRFTGIKYTLMNPESVVIPVKECAAEPANSEHAQIEHVQIEDVQNGQILRNTDLLHNTDSLHKPDATNTRAKNAPQNDPATDGWLAFGHEVLGAAGIDPSRSMVQTGCVRQWLADAGKAGYTRQQAEAVILEVVRERSQYGGKGKPPAWFSRPVQEAIAQGSLKSTQSAAECVLPEWEGDCRRAYHAHVLSLCNGAGKAMSREAFTEQWKKERGIKE